VNCMAEKYFRLVELYVIILIILIGVCLIPATLGKLSKNAQQVSCSSRLANIGRGLISYSNDADGLYPWGWGGKIVRTWDVTLLPYLNNPAKPYHAFDCPQSQGEKMNDKGLQKRIRGIGRRSYIANGRLFLHIKPGRKQFSMFNIRNTMQTGVVFDGPVRFVGSGSQFNTSNPKQLIGRHNNRINILFADGHTNKMLERNVAKKRTLYP
jgi:prepilin-type processing-associated H-X9-DG protein